jgi:uncharacterized protein YdaU (DUF1376 family)
MEKPPYFPFYVQDFSSDGIVEAMTTQQVGAYILLLCKSWREDPPGSLPSNDLTLSRWSRMTSDEWTASRDGVLAAFTLGTDGRYYQKRMREEYKKLVDLYKKRSDAGRTAAKERWKDAIRITNASDSHIERSSNECQQVSDSDSEFGNKGGLKGAGETLPTRESVISFGKTIECPEEDCVSFFNHFHSQGWIKSSGLPITDWKTRLEAWKQDQIRKAATGQRGAKSSHSGMAINSIAQADSLIKECENAIMKIKDDDRNFEHFPDPPFKKLKEEAKTLILSYRNKIEDVRKLKLTMKIA